MYQVHRVATTQRLQGTLTLLAEAGIDAVLFRETDALHRWYQDWWYPVPRLDDERIVLHAGESAQVDLRPEARWLVMIRKHRSTTTGRARLQFVDANDGSGDPVSPEPQSHEGSP